VPTAYTPAHLPRTSLKPQSYSSTRQFGGGDDDEAAAAAAALVAQLSAANDSKALLEALAALPQVGSSP
jgi:hypothetical protein